MLDSMLFILSKIRDLYYRKTLYRNKNITIGKYSYGSPKIFTFDKNTKLEIGKFCSISNNVKILLGGEHRIDWLTTFPFNKRKKFSYIKGHPHSKGNIIIGNDVWVGLNTTILSGVTIGDGAVIGAFSVVTRDIPPYTVVAGNPAKVIKKRFDDKTIEALLSIKWWEWEYKNIEKIVPMLLQNDIKKIQDIKDISSE